MAMQEGRTAAMVAGIIRPYIDQKIQMLVINMAQLYRSRQAEFPALLGIAAQMALCMDMLSDLESKVRRGNQAAKEEVNAQKPS